MVCWTCCATVSESEIVEVTTDEEKLGLTIKGEGLEEHCLVASGQDCEHRSCIPTILDMVHGGEVVDLLDPLEPGKFVVDIWKDASGAGMDIECVGEALIIARLRPGAVQEWNDSQEKHCAVRVGDRIVRVNDADGDHEALVEELTTRRRLRMVLQRGTEFQVELHKGGRPLGICVISGNGKLDMLKISALREGVVEDWSAENPDKRIRPDDCITGVNGFSNDPERMLKELGDAEDLVLTMLRPA